MYTGCGTLGMIKGYVAKGIFRMGALNYFKDFSSVDRHKYYNSLIDPLDV
jgi:hypothetical protein